MPDIPEWVLVWFWLRFQRDPQDTRPLPQQHTGLPETVGHAEYERLAEEWRLFEGRASPSEVVSALSVNPLLLVPERNPILEV